jgi:hypothetical protein
MKLRHFFLPAIILACVIYASTITPTWEKAESFNVCWQDAPEPNQPAIQIKAPRTCEVGELVRIDMNKSTVTTTVVLLTIPGLKTTTDFEMIEQGKRAFFSSRRPGEYLIIVAGAKDNEPYIYYQRLTVKGIKGELEPTPATPDLASDCEEWMGLVEDYDGKTIHTMAVAMVFRKLADQADVTVDNMLEASAVANSAVLGEDLTHWLPFFDKLGEKLDEYSSSGKLSTRDDYRRAWLAIAEGIENG